ncbi:MAG: protein-disulfide reductase DsbD [Endozoicomonadaceae bacterium]|nr:protein-disulfide reductase DsbD [Endozoicomonadaceae bacterium]
MYQRFLSVFTLKIIIFLNVCWFSSMAVSVIQPSGHLAIQTEANHLNSILQADIRYALDATIPKPIEISAAEASLKAPLSIHEDETVYADWLKQKHPLWLVLSVFFILGILLAFTPCVLPMMPILISILSKYPNKKLIVLTLAYILGSALTYAVIGVLIALFGATFNVQIWLQSPWVISSMAILFLGLALSMWGFYDVTLPTCIQNKLRQWDDQYAKKTKGSILTVGLMGVLSALIISPCLTAPLIGVLLYISSTEQAVLGGLVLFSIGLGIGVPLFCIGLGLDRFIPRSGPWLLRIKQSIALLMLGVAIWLISRLLPDYIVLILWGFWLILSTSFILFVCWKRSKTCFFSCTPIFIVLIGYSLILIVGGCLKQVHWMNPLNGLDRYPEALSHDENWMILDTPEELIRLKKALSKRNKKSVVYFSADWCSACQEIKKTILNHVSIKNKLKAWDRIHFDVTKTTASQLKMMQEMRIFGVPVLIFYDQHGQELKRYIGIVNITTLLNQLTAWADYRIEK